MPNKPGFNKNYVKISLFIWMFAVCILIVWLCSVIKIVITVDVDRLDTEESEGNKDEHAVCKQTGFLCVRLGEEVYVPETFLPQSAIVHS